MTSQENKDLIRRTYQAISRGELEGLEDHIADDVVEHEEFPGMEPNKEGVIRFFRHMRAAFPDLEMKPDDILADGDLVAVRGTMQGTHQGEFMDVPATGNRVTVRFADFFRLRDGRVVEHWGVTDSQALMEQLGVRED